jgi:hypothetical protein
MVEHRELNDAFSSDACEEHGGGGSADACEEQPKKLPQLIGREDAAQNRRAQPDDSAGPECSQNPQDGIRIERAMNK